MDTKITKYPHTHIEDFHLSDESKAHLMFVACAFEMNLDEIVEKGMKAIGYQECHEGCDRDFYR